MQEIRAGLAGYGVGGAYFHAPLIAAVEGVRLAAIATRRRDEVERAWPGVRVVPTPAELAADPGIDLIVVSTPTANHFESARAALAAGKHVVVDKPFTVTVSEADELMDLA